mgnify:FL=1
MTITVFENALSKSQCDHLISLAKNKWNTGVTTAAADSMDQFARKSDICWIKDESVKKQIREYYLTANENAQWNFDIKGMEDVQIARYRKGEFYNWHTDGDGIRPIPSEPTIVRKISMSIILNDGYKGGELEIKHLSKIPNTMGTIIVFPSYFTHRVKPVRRGTRYSLVAWFGGPKFK